VIQPHLNLHIRLRGSDPELEFDAVRGLDWDALVLREGHVANDPRLQLFFHRTNAYGDRKLAELMDDLIEAANKIRVGALRRLAEAGDTDAALTVAVEADR
jgi:hypothetical protein